MNEWIEVKYHPFPRGVPLGAPEMWPTPGAFMAAINVAIRVYSPMCSDNDKGDTWSHGDAHTIDVVAIN